MTRLAHSFLPVLAVALLLTAGCRVGGRATVGLDTSPRELSLRHGEVAPLKMGWEPLESAAEASAPLTVFIHLVNRSGDTVRTFDHPFPGQSLSEPVEATVPLFHSLLAPALPTGEYILTAGLVDAAGKRLALATPGRQSGRRAYEIATIQIPEGSVEAGIRFSEEWSQPIRGTSLQVHTARLLASEGTLEVERLTDPASLWLALQVGPAGEAEHCGDGERALRPEVRVRSQCSEATETLTGCGHHEVELPLPGAGSGCVVEVAPSHSGGVSDSFHPLRITLQQLGWAARPDRARSR